MGNYASRDAARVGEGLYGHVLDSLLTLAQDPAPNVAKLSNAVLNAANVQLTPISHGAGLFHPTPLVPGHHRCNASQ